ncbi:MAG: VacJ family lipoprotein [Desulfobulbus oligotrophicus]|nr:VacJ family lipoprotein [Desulfobulbus oligotrophicus]
MILRKSCQTFSRYVFVLVLVFCHGISWGQEVDYLDDESYEPSSVSDPLEPVNRFFFNVNDKVYVWVLEPVSTGYSKVLPSDIRQCVSNFFYNLGEPVRAVNCLLQGRVHDAGRTLGRFVINSICGVFGLADPAAHEFKMSPVYASLGETFSVWGVGDGFYLVVPLLGPSTLRDLTGTVGDGFAMTTHTPWNDDVLTTAAAHGVRSVNYTSLHLGEYEDAKSLSFDPYIAFRNGYFQIRAKQFDHTHQ